MDQLNETEVVKVTVDGSNGKRGSVDSSTNVDHLTELEVVLFKETGMISWQGRNLADVRDLILVRKVPI